MINKLRRKGDDMRERIYLNNGWKFSESYDEAMCFGEFDENGMEEVRLPHTC